MRLYNTVEENVKKHLQMNGHNLTKSIMVNKQTITTQARINLIGVFIVFICEQLVHKKWNE